MNEKFEYKVCENVETATLNELGEDGWELVTIQSFSNVPVTRYFFKRRK